MPPILEQYPQQEPELLYALDIGTRSVVGVLARREGERMQILAVEERQHAKRAMKDGQIEEIGQVAAAVREVTDRLERRIQRRLERACVAAAGRALRTRQGNSLVELPAPEAIGTERIRQLELAAVGDAEQGLQEEGGGLRLFLVGYTVTRYQLDQYPLPSLQGHTGRVLEAAVVATFLPSEVIDSLYAVMRQAGLSVASLTLEPIAALNAAIPAQLRLLNLALVDIGAGTSDIALCRDGGVVGYTMATVAGDEITEALMRAYLLDYQTAERMKAELAQDQPVRFTDILGLEQALPPEEILAEIDGAVQTLAEEIARQVLELNGGPPSALFLAGGGSRLFGLSQRVALAVGMDPKRVTVAGRYFQDSAYAEDLDLNDPAYTTPLGIAISSGLGLISDSYRIELNGKPARLFRSGALTALEVLMMNGFSSGDLLGRGGRSLLVQVDGRRCPLYGKPAMPARLRINGREAPPSAPVRSGDRIEFEPARPGADCAVTAGELAGKLGAAGFLCRGRRLAPETPLETGMELVTIPGEQRRAAAGQPEEKVTPPPAALTVELNGKRVSLPPKADGAPYYVMDLLERSGIDFQHVQRPVRLRVNQQACTFQQALREHDAVEICYEDET